MPISGTCFSSSVSALNFKWMHKGIRYLGLQRSPNLQNIMSLNMDPLLQKLQIKLELNLTLWGKITIIKLVVATQFNYISGNGSSSKAFIWEGKRPRTGINKLCLPREKGSLALPNVELYKIAFEMSKLTRDENDSALDWVHIEQQLTFPFRPIEALSQKLEGELQHND